MPERIGRAGDAERDAKLNAIGETVERVEHRCRADEPEALVIDFPSGSLIATIDDSIGMLVLEWMPPSARRQLRMYRALIGRMYDPEPPRRFEGFRMAGDVPDGIMAGETPLSGVRLFDFKMGFEGGPPEPPASIPLTYTRLDEWRGWPRLRRPWWDPRSWPGRVWDYLTGADVLPHPYLPRYSVGQYGGVHSFTAEPAEPREERKRDDGSPMGREELRELLIGNVTCGCGDPYAVAQLVLDVLALHPLYEGGALAEQPSDGLWYFVLGVLDSLGLTEHGGSIGGGWLTDKGKATLAALERERNDGFEELFD